jgi:hypothetical protein
VSNFEDDTLKRAFSAACHAIVIVYVNIRKALCREPASGKSRRRKKT